MQFKRISRLVFALLMVLIISNGLVYAQEENLLTNPGFEGGFSSAGVANGWVSWVSSDANAPDFQEAPEYFAASTASDRNLIPQVRSGSEAQAIFSFFATHDAGIYQQVSDLSEGTELRFSIYAHVFSNRLDDVNQSEDPGGVTIRVGIDPTGGVDPFSSNIQYTEPFITYDTYIQYNTIAVAESDTVTVFVRSTVTEPVNNTIVFLDDAVLNITPESSTPTEETPTEETPTEETPTEEPQDPTPTRESGVETEETPTEETPTQETPTQATPTQAPSDTPISNDFPGQIIHTVRSGDTVGRLAVRYGSSIAAITQANGLNESALIFVGQGLIIPVRIVPATETPSPTSVVVVVTATPGGGTTGNGYVVQAGDTLSSIARRFNTTVGALVQLNGIANENRIFAGQRLSIPGTGGVATPAPTNVPAATATPINSGNGGIIPPAPVTTYRVQPGDNLYRIALRNGVSLVALADANNITNYNLIFIGQVLTISDE